MAIDAILAIFDAKSVFAFIAFVAVCGVTHTAWEAVERQGGKGRAAIKTQGVLMTMAYYIFGGAWYFVNIYLGSFTFSKATFGDDLAILAILVGILPSAIQAYLIFTEEYRGQNNAKELVVALIDVVMTALGIGIRMGVAPNEFLNYAYSNPAEALLIAGTSFVGNYLIESMVLRKLKTMAMTEKELQIFNTPPTKKFKKARP